MTPTGFGKTSTRPTLLELACRCSEGLGVEGVLVIPEGRIDWDLVKDAAGDIPVLVAAETERLAEVVKEAGLIAVEVEATDAAIIERISLALIEAVANDQLRAGAKILVVYAGFEAEALDTMTVVRLGEHLERLSARDWRALETSVPFETLKAVVDVAVEIGREGREGKAVGTTPAEGL